MKRIFLTFIILNSLLLSESTIPNSIKEFNTDALVNQTTKHIFNLLPSKYKFIEDVIAKAEAKKSILKIVYFTSSSVPVKSHVQEIKDASVLMNKFNVNAKQVLIGLESDGLKSYMEKLTESLRGVKKSQRIAGKIELAPMLFKKYKIDRVPAHAIGVCKNEDVHSEECEYLYIARGDAPLKYFLELLKEENEYFRELYEAL